jgi:hypothetical protein
VAGFPDDLIQRNIRTARDFILQWYGTLASTRPVESDYTIGASTVVALGAINVTRVGLILSNTGAGNIAVSFNPAVTISTGILLEPGGTFISSWYYDLELVTYPLYAIGAGSGETLHMIENVITGA